MISLEKKSRARNWLTETVKGIYREIDEQVEEVGGENMLIGRIDILHWVYYKRDTLKMYQEALRLLDGDPAIDEKLVSAAIQQTKCDYSGMIEEKAFLKESVIETENRLKEIEEQMPVYDAAVDVMENMLKECNRGS